MDQTFNIFQWNARSVAVNLSYLLQHLALHKYKILVLQSLNVTSNKLPKIPNYYYPPVYSKSDCKPQNKIYTAIYAYQGLQYSPCESPVATHLSDIHSCAVSVKVNNSLVLNIVSVYLPRGPNDHNTEWLNLLDDSKEKWFIGGDFNAHSPLWEKQCNIVTNNRLVENLMNCPLYLLNNENQVTRIPDVSYHRATSIDLSLISPSLVPHCNWDTHTDTLGSDHLPIRVTLNEKLCVDEMTKDKIPKFNYKKANWSKFKELLNSYNTNEVYDDDVDKFYSNFSGTLLSAADKSIPKYFSVRSDKHSGNVWWNSACQAAVDNKKQKAKNYIKTRKPDAHEEMKKANIESNKIIAQAKQDHWASFCKTEVSSHNDVPKVWQKLHEMKKGIKLPQYPIKFGNNKFPSNAEKAEAFVNMFSDTMRTSSLPSDRQQYRASEERQETYKDPVPQNDHCINSSITTEEVRDAISLLGNKKTSVGLDIVSNQMLQHLPDKYITLLCDFFQKCWISGRLPSIWKQSIIIPILKQGKPRYDIDNYRPIALTSHTGKLMERLVLNRLAYYCEKMNVIPVNQAGFRKGRSTIDHIVKLTTQIKSQFAKRKNLLATFFDVRKAYDSVWHSRLLFKLKSVGLSGHIYDYVKDFLKNRMIQAKVGHTYSTYRSVDMGIPQGSVIAPMLFTILLHDLPKALTTNVTLVQYADDICMWIKVDIKKKTHKRKINYIRRLYQMDLDNLLNFMSVNGMTLSAEKTNMMLFSNGAIPEVLPNYTIDGIQIQYVKFVKFLGVFLTQTLNWKFHIDHVLNKARKSLNFLKVISKQHWGKDTCTLKHLAISLVRSKLSYGQEVYFNAPKHLLTKLQSVDCKSLKLALGVPFHTSNISTCREIGVLPLDEFRKLSVTKYVVRSVSVPNFNRVEIKTLSSSQYPKRAQNIASLESIGTYTSGPLTEAEINLNEIAPQPLQSPVPPWEMQRAVFDVDDSNLTKKEHPHVLASRMKSRIHERYAQHLHVYTDGSLLDNHQTGAGFVIPSLKIKKSFYIGKNRSVFVAELVAILMALNFLLDLAVSVYQVLICVDSKSVLSSLQSINLCAKIGIVSEIKTLIHLLTLKGTYVTFLWIPSHCGIYGNDWADRIAKEGANKSFISEKIHTPITAQECYCQLQKVFWNNFKQVLKNENRLLKDCKAESHFFKNMSILNNYFFAETVSLHMCRSITSLFYRVKLDSYITKFSKNVTCPCGQRFINHHILLECPAFQSILPSFDQTPLSDILCDSALILQITLSFIQCPFSKCL